MRGARETERGRGRDTYGEKETEEEDEKEGIFAREICMTNMDSQSCGLTIFFTLFNTRDYLSHSA